MATQVFLNIPEIPGNSTLKAYPKQFEVLSLSFGAVNPSNPAATGGGGAGKPSFTPITLTLNQYDAPGFLKYLATGRHIMKATITVVGASTGETAGSKFEVITLTDVLISSVQLTESGGDQPLMEVSLAYAQIEVNETASNTDFTFNLKTLVVS